MAVTASTPVELVEEVYARLPGRVAAARERFDYVVSLCDRVREVCPEFPGHPDLIHWSVPDPSRETGSDARIYQAFERITDELAKRIAAFLKLVDHNHRVAQRIG